MIRTSFVKHIRIKSVILSSIVHIGDVGGIYPDARILAVQREKTVYLGNEGDLRSFNVFIQPFVRNQTLEEVSIRKVNKNALIHVNSIDILGISASSVLQVGNAGTLDCTSRTKHIRHLLPRDERGAPVQEEEYA